MPDDIKIQRDGYVEIITIDRPEVRNALTFETYDQLEAAVRETTARCLVITGSDPAFCSGDDVRAVMGGGERKADHRHRAHAGRRRPPTCRSSPPHRPQVGWGMELAMMCDIRVAPEGQVRRAVRAARLVHRRGGRPLAQLVGREVTAELLFTGDVIDAARAKEIGLVSRVVPHEQVVSEAVALATKIADRPPLAVAKIKEGLRLALDPNWTSLGEWVSTSLSALFQTDDHREGVKSFLEKRAPVYTGR
jgi:enoyl-CoA hydratase